MKQYIDRAPATWVEGQLIEYKVVRGNAWMTLRDLDEDVSFSVTAWRNVASQLDPTIQEGSRVVAQLKPNLYPKTGRLSMIAHDMRPVGLGDLLARIERLRRQLADEGLTDPSRKKPLPVLPRVIGLITGRDSDAMKDVMRNTHLRWPATRFRVINTAVQGTNAPHEVMTALTALDADPEVDVIVIARGGGALEEVILPFSDEALMRAVAAATTPIVSAIGHEADRPVLDDVADLRASTPTDAAKHIVPDAATELDMLTQAQARMLGAMTRRLDLESQNLAHITSRPALTDPLLPVTQRADDLAQLGDRMRRVVAHRVERDTTTIEQLRARIVALSPQQTLSRGYAVVQHGSQLLRSPESLTVGDSLNVLLASGQLTADVSSIHASQTPADPRKDA